MGARLELTVKHAALAIGSHHASNSWRAQSSVHDMPNIARCCALQAPIITLLGANPDVVIERLMELLSSSSPRWGEKQSYHHAF